MKLYHYGLFFALVCAGFFMTAQIALILKMQEESINKTEYDCLVASVDAVADVVFTNEGNNITEVDLERAEDIFFQTLGVLWYGTTDCSTWEELRMRVPCIVIFTEDGYYRYSFKQEKGYGWSEMVPYEQGEIPACFFKETEQLLAGYHDGGYANLREYRIEQAAAGVWEQELSPPCVFAIYAPVRSGLSDDERGFVYAASGYQTVAYYVTEDNCCHLSSCAEFKDGNVISCYSSQKESAEAGAIPCENCMK